MSRKKIFISLIPIVILVLLAGSCKRQGVTEPDPFGPGTSRLTMDLEAHPNVVLVTEAGREMSEITATVKLDGAPYAGATVIFTVETGLGEFSNYERRIAITTNGNGLATVTYVSPSLAEFTRDYDLTIEALIQTNSPFSLLRSVKLRIMRPRE